jgi:ketosteroid isomerase-like protein
MKMKKQLFATKTIVRSTTSNATEADGMRFFRQPFPSFLAGGLALGIFVAIAANSTNALPADDRKIVAGLDTEYQEAVKKNDAATMGRILADDFVLVTGSGKTYTKDDLLTEARSGHVVYEHQEDTAQTVRLWGDTAVVTAKLWEKGTDNGKPFDYTVWFSDTYVRTPTGWRYVFGQSSLQCPKLHE